MWIKQQTPFVMTMTQERRRGNLLTMTKIALHRLVAMALVCALVSPDLLMAQQAGYTFKAQSELVLVNVSVRDSHGNLVRDLKPEDFTVLEDNKPQKIASFDIENTESVPVVPQQQVALLTNTPKKVRATVANPNPAPSAEEQAIKDRRLIILFFDLSAMQPDEIERSVDRCAKLSEQADGAGRPGVDCVAEQHHHRQSRFHLQP